MANSMPTTRPIHQHSPSANAPICAMADPGAVGTRITQHGQITREARSPSKTERALLPPFSVPLQAAYCARRVETDVLSQDNNGKAARPRFPHATRWAHAKKHPSQHDAHSCSDLPTSAQGPARFHANIPRTMESPKPGAKIASLNGPTRAAIMATFMPRTATAALVLLPEPSARPENSEELKGSEHTTTRDSHLYKDVHDMHILRSLAKTAQGTSVSPWELRAQALVHCTLIRAYSLIKVLHGNHIRAGPFQCPEWGLIGHGAARSQYGSIAPEYRVGQCGSNASVPFTSMPYPTHTPQ